MTIALQRNTDGSDTVFFDAILNYSQSYQSKLTSHPIDSSNNKDHIYSVNDHIITENPTFTLKGVISGADFGTGRPSSSEYPLSNTVTLSGDTTVKSATDSILDSVAGSLLPFGKNAEPEISFATRIGTPLPLIKNLLISIRDNKETITLVEFTNGNPTNTELDLVITSLQFSEDPNTGDSLSVDMTLQRASFVELVWTKTPIKNTSGNTKVRAQTTVDKGTQSSEAKKDILQESASIDLEGILPIKEIIKYKNSVLEVLKGITSK